MERRTPLYDTHVAEGGKMVAFAGWELPVQYPTGILAEHEAVRTRVGLFDVSHMGEIHLAGPDALPTLNHLISNDYTNLACGRARYGVLMNEQGGCHDDLIVYRLADEDWLVVVNAANREKDFAHISANLVGTPVCEDISDEVCQLALQGPRAREVMAKLADPETLPARYYAFTRHVTVAGMDCLVSRSGYTGEFGYEIYSAPENAVALWKAIREAGQEYELLPCGLGARDTLRLEAAMPLYGHELSEEITPLEAGLDFAVKLEKDEFVGREALLAQGEPTRVRVGIVAEGRGIIREDQDVYAADELVGHTTSGTFAPHLKKAIAMAYVKREASEVGSELSVDVRGRRVAAKVVPLPFYKHA